MSQVTFAREGYTAILDAITAGIVPWFKLFVNDPALSIDSTRADFVEADFVGYAPVKGPTWTPAALRGGIAFAVVDPVIFQYDGEGDGPLIKGYFVTAGDAGPLLWAWRRPGMGFKLTEASRILTVLAELDHPAPNPL